MNKNGKVVIHDIAGAISCGIALEGREIPVSPQRGVITVDGALWAYSQLRRSDRDVWDLVGAHRIANRQVFVERKGEIIDDAVVAQMWSLAAARNERIPSDRITATVSGEWLAVVDGDHKVTFSGRKPSTPLDGWRQ